jgi:hypothetical protein
MNITLSLAPHKLIKPCLIMALVVSLTALSTSLKADTGTCGGQSITLPFTDVPAANIFFCSIAEAFFAGLTNGTGTGSTYSPSANVNREQMAAFITRTLDQSLKRGSRRAALGQWWRPNSETDLATTTVGDIPSSVKSDGISLWVANLGGNTVMRIDAATGGLTGTWTGATQAQDILVAKGKVFVLGQSGSLFQIDPTQAPGAISPPFVTGLGAICKQLAFDGSNLWGTSAASNHVFKVALNPVGSQFFTADFVDPNGIFFDGSNIWVTDNGDDTLKKLNADGTVATTVSLPGAGFTGFVAFDGINLWVPGSADRLFVVRIKDSGGNPVGTPSVLATLTGNGLLNPTAAAFDGERVLVMNDAAAPNAGVSLWKAADLSPLGSLATTNPTVGVCSDGINFWFTLNLGPGTPGKLARF